MDTILLDEAFREAKRRVIGYTRGARWQGQRIFVGICRNSPPVVVAIKGKTWRILSEDEEKAYHSYAKRQKNKRSMINSTNKREVNAVIVGGFSIKLKAEKGICPIARKTGRGKIKKSRVFLPRNASETTIEVFSYNLMSHNKRAREQRHVHYARRGKGKTLLSLKIGKRRQRYLLGTRMYKR